MGFSYRQRSAWVWLTVTCACVAVQRESTAQQTVPFENGTPIAPAGFEPLPIPAEPRVAGAIHFAHSTGSDRGNDLVRT